MKVITLTQKATSTGSYEVITYSGTANTKTSQTGSYSIDSLDETAKTYTLNFVSAATGTLPTDINIDYTDMALFKAFHDNDDKASGWKFWLTTKINGAYNLKFADTDDENRTVIDLKNKKIYSWEEPEGGSESYETDTLTIVEIPGGYQITEVTEGNILYLYPAAEMDGDAFGTYAYYDANDQTYTVDGFDWDTSNLLSASNVFKDGTYCAYFADPRNVTGSPTWDELHIMTISGNTISDQLYDSDEVSMTAIEERTMTFEKFDDLLVQITPPAGDVVYGILSDTDTTNGVHEFAFTPSDAIYYEIEALTEANISGKVFALTIMFENDGYIKETLGNTTFNSDKSISGLISGTWSIENGLLHIDNDDNTDAYIYKLKNPLTTGTGFRFFVKTINGTESDIERGNAVEVVAPR